MLTFLRPYPSPLLSPRGIDVDLPLLLGCLALLGLGLVMVASASSEIAAAQAGGALHYGIRQASFLLIGLLAGILVLMVPVATWQRLGWMLLAAAFFLLVLVLVVGREINGSIRWIPLGPLNLQASEVAKVFVVVYLAGYLVRRQEEVRESWSGFLKPIAVLIPMAGLLLLEPDFGATIVLLGAAAGMLFLGGVGLVRFGLSAGLAVGAVWLLIKTQPYRVARLTTFTDPWSDQFGAGYQLTQALIAFGRGEWLGVGLGNSVQKLFYLPEAHTDFVFAIWAEEFGLVGALLVVGAFAGLIGAVLRIGRTAEHLGQLFGAYLCYGTALMLSGQVFINIGVNIGLLPTKGLTLPFFSYGGSSVLVCLTLMGLVWRVAAELPRTAAVVEKAARTGRGGGA